MERPDISVIVPIYNVEEYLEECLSSLERQHLESYEVILINDGSTDGSKAIAQDWERKNNCFRYLEISNSGQGAARNHAMRYATGKYIAFCDADDIVPEFAYKHMLALAEKHGCDFVTGAVGRFDSQKTKPSRLHRKALTSLDEIAHIATHTQLIFDTSPCNKLFSHSFLEECRFQFPEGILFEDLPASLKLHLMAKKCAFLDEIVYLWRIRDASTTSSSQNKMAIGALENRLEAIKLIDKIFQEHVRDDRLFREKTYKYLNNDMVLYVNPLPWYEDEERRNTVRNLVLNFINAYDESDFDEIDAINRIKYHYLRLGDYENLAKAIELSRQKNLYACAELGEDGNYYTTMGFEDIPPQLGCVTRELIRHGMRTTIEKVLLDDTGLRVQGAVSVPLVKTRPNDQYDIQFSLVSSLRDQQDLIAQTTCSVKERTVEAEATAEGDDCAFVCEYDAFFPHDQLKALANGTFKIFIEMTFNGLEFSPSTLRFPDKGRQARPYPFVFNERIMTVLYNSLRELKLNLEDMTSPVIRKISAEDCYLDAIDKTGTHHLIDFRDIDLDNHRIGDPLDRPYYYLSKAPTFCMYEDGLLCMSRISSGQPHISFKETGGLLMGACITHPKLQLRVKLAKSANVKRRPDFAFYDEATQSKLSPRLKISKSHDEYSVEINLEKVKGVHPNNRVTYSFVVFDKEGQPLPIYKGSPHCPRTKETVLVNGLHIEINIVTAAGCKLIIGNAQN